MLFRSHRDATWEAIIVEAIKQADTSIRELIDKYHYATDGIETTEYYDPFNIDEEITF